MILRSPLKFERLNCRSVDVPSARRTVQELLPEVHSIRTGWFRLMASTRASWHMLTIVLAARLRLAWGIHFSKAVPDKPASIPITATAMSSSTTEKPLCRLALRSLTKIGGCVVMIGLGSKFNYLIKPYNNSIKVHKDFHPSEKSKLWGFSLFFLWII